MADDTDRCQAQFKLIWDDFPTVPGQHQEVGQEAPKKSAASGARRPEEFVQTHSDCRCVLGLAFPHDQNAPAGSL